MVGQAATGLCRRFVVVAGAATAVDSRHVRQSSGILDAAEEGAGEGDQDVWQQRHVQSRSVPRRPRMLSGAPSFLFVCFL